LSKTQSSATRIDDNVYNNLQYNALELLLEPVYRVVLSHLVVDANLGGAMFTSSYSVPGADKYNEEIHTENTSGGIVLQTQIDVLVDAETEAASGGEVFSLQLILSHLQATIKDLLSLLATNLITT
jgi:hypothetical protein